MAGRPPRGHLAVASAIMVVGVLISASLFGAEAARTTVTETFVSTIIETKTCPNVTGIEQTAPVAPLALVFTNATSGIQDLWNATVTAYAGSTQVFSQCLMGINVGELHVSDQYLSNHGVTFVMVTAQKMDANYDNLTLRVRGLQNSTGVPFGFVSISMSPNP